MNTIAILNSTAKINPLDPTTAEYYNENQVCYVLRTPSGSVIALTSFGELYSNYTTRTTLQVGEVIECHADQSGRYMGRFTILGVAMFATGGTAGAVCDRKLKHYVVK